MNTLIAKLIVDAIDTSKIPGIDFIDLEKDGAFIIYLNDCTLINVQVIIKTQKQ
jgi:hypothetical protein